MVNVLALFDCEGEQLNGHTRGVVRALVVSLSTKPTHDGLSLFGLCAGRLFLRPDVSGTL